MTGINIRLRSFFFSANYAVAVRATVFWFYTIFFVGFFALLCIFQFGDFRELDASGLPNMIGTAFACILASMLAFAFLAVSILLARNYSPDRKSGLDTVKLLQDPTGTIDLNFLVLVIVGMIITGYFFDRLMSN